MASLEGVLARIPGLGGFVASQQMGQQQDMNNVRQLGVLQEIMQRQQQAQEQQQLKGMLSQAAQQAGGDPAKMAPLLMQSGHPKLIELAQKMMPKQASPQFIETVAADGKTPIRRAVIPTAGDIYPIAPKEQVDKGVWSETFDLNGVQVQRNSLTNEIRTAASRPPQIRVGLNNPEPPKGDFSKVGDDFLNTLPIQMRSMVKGVGNYEINPMTFAARLGNREKMLEMVRQYNPDYDDTQYANKRRAIAQFGSGPQGNTVRSLNVAIEHIDTLQRAADALKNGDFTPGNKVYNEVAKVFGVTPPNTFEGMRDIVANEVVKGTIGNAGALTDRQEAAAKIKAAASPDQLKELMTGWTELMGGQVKGLEQQYAGASGLKDFRKRYLTQRAQDAISLAERKAGAGNQVREFSTEAEAIASGVKGKVKIGGRNANIE